MNSGGTSRRGSFPPRALFIYLHTKFRDTLAAGTSLREKPEWSDAVSSRAPVPVAARQGSCEPGLPVLCCCYLQNIFSFQSSIQRSIYRFCCYQMFFFFLQFPLITRPRPAQAPGGLPPWEPASPAPGLKLPASISILSSCLLTCQWPPSPSEHDTTAVQSLPQKQPTRAWSSAPQLFHRFGYLD